MRDFDLLGFLNPWNNIHFLYNPKNVRKVWETSS
jgi:hypothetical protein